jgi:hypothetical protein
MRRALGASQIQINGIAKGFGQFGSSSKIGGVVGGKVANQSAIRVRRLKLFLSIVARRDKFRGQHHGNVDQLRPIFSTEQPKGRSII